MGGVGLEQDEPSDKFKVFEVFGEVVLFGEFAAFLEESVEVDFLDFADDLADGLCDEMVVMAHLFTLVGVFLEDLAKRGVGFGFVDAEVTKEIEGVFDAGVIEAEFAVVADIDEEVGGEWVVLLALVGLVFLGAFCEVLLFEAEDSACCDDGVVFGGGYDGVESEGEGLEFFSVGFEEEEEFAAEVFKAEVGEVG